MVVRKQESRCHHSIDKVKKFSKCRAIRYFPRFFWGKDLTAGEGGEGSIGICCLLKLCQSQPAGPPNYPFKPVSGPGARRNVPSLLSRGYPVSASASCGVTPPFSH